MWPNYYGTWRGFRQAPSRPPPPQKKKPQTLAPLGAKVHFPVQHDKTSKMTRVSSEAVLRDRHTKQCPCLTLGHYILDLNPSTVSAETASVVSQFQSAWASVQSDESSLSAWRSVGSLGTHKAHSKDWSDWADLSLGWAHREFCWFWHAVAQMFFFTFQVCKNVIPQYK